MSARYSNPKGDMVERFSPAQADLAQKIANDIAEDIDCGENRRRLRMAVAYWADVAAVEAQRRAVAESKVAVFQTAKAFMDSALGEDVPVRHVISAKARRANITKQNLNLKSNEQENDTWKPDVPPLCAVRGRPAGRRKPTAGTGD